MVKYSFENTLGVNVMSLYQIYIIVKDLTDGAENTNIILKGKTLKICITHLI